MENDYYQEKVIINDCKNHLKAHKLRLAGDAAV
jgi:hypothetical protein